MSFLSSDNDKNMKPLPEIFLPVKKLIRNGNNKYQVTETYKNLLVHRFTEYEKDFLCECYESKSESILGITSMHGLPRLTVPGIEKRYNIPSQIFNSWLTEYKNKANNVKKRKYKRRRPLDQDPLSYIKDKPRSRSYASSINNPFTTGNTGDSDIPINLTQASEMDVKTIVSLVPAIEPTISAVEHYWSTHTCYGENIYEVNHNSMVGLLELQDLFDLSIDRM